MKYKKILSEIKKATNIMIVTHESPDGDAIGSSLSMYLVLKQMGKNPDLVIKEYSQCFNFLPSLSYSITIPRNIDYDLVISLDCAKISRLNEIEYVEKAKKIINIDHHISNELYGNYNLVNGEIPACCQLLFNLFRDWKIKMNKEIATSLLVGIITDTNGLRTSGINKDLFLDIYKLLDFDIDLSDLYNRVLTTITKAKFELYKIASNRLEFFCKNKIAFTYITEKDKQEVGAKIGDHEGIVDIGRAIEGG